MQYSGFNKILRSVFVQTLLNKLDDGTFSDFFEDWKWIFSYSRKYTKVIICYTIIGIISSTLGLVSSVASKYMIDIITGYQFEKLWLVAVIMVSSMVVSLLFTSLVNRYSTKLSIYVNNDMQADIFDRIIDADWLSISQFENGDILNRFNNDVNTVASNAVSWLPNLIIYVYSIAATLAVILYYDATMALIALLSAPILLLSGRYLMRKNSEYRRKVLEVNSKLMNYEVETFYNFDTIKSFGVMEHYSKGLRGWQERFKQTNLAYNLFTIKTNIGMSVLSAGVSFLAFGYCLFRLWTGDILYGTMTLFLEQRSKLSNQFSNLVRIIPGMLNSAVSARRIRELVELPREVHMPEQSERMRQAAQHGFTVQLEHVNFAYIQEHRVLTDSNFIASPGEIVALVGPSGEGKTTMLRMILGLLHPNQGTAQLVTQDGETVPIHADTRRYFSYVPQGNTLMSGTIADNLRVVKEDATEEEIKQALETACAWEFVQKMPDGIHSLLGTRGRGVSEGQAQRISIARAVLRDAPILLLDEATSALDVATERQVLRNIMHRHPNKTCIVTTHRPSVLNLCQRIYRVIDTKVTQLDEQASNQMVQDF
ncbi:MULTISPECIES: ABC transporter ATP-binding protein [Butyricicoccus]|jgi:ABC-type bacteriocin/lantibiotic exporter with double-glycine peptidase domain|uniref:ABC transporter ATP-binding protein/permease n=1 Tax=Butyricicoccus intestinisimiae TaxID=2841509 RepID=A0ABS6EU02_9FIRM|nr:ABC transporter ATP-binding protein [Butyricicoccus intestinisimiae]MBU5491153.1 ABC transporter ATP-binding protein/permease [Butyricicoccus intestinisimiae]MEE0326316.1 ABC transporter ATP-binding protein [Butyricicoccus sp.]